MEDSEQQQPSIVLKHYCKVCKRGFGCAGALGGHMRSHGAGGDSRVRHPSSSEDQKCISDLNYNKSDQGNNKHSYFLRKTNRLVTSYNRESEDHDKRPSSSSSTRLQGCNERGKCTMDDEMMMLPVSSSESEDESKRTKSGKYDDNYCASSEEEDLANCLVMLSNKSFVLSDKEENKAKEVEKGMFQCKACKKVFSSHQALGGHRASHKKVKGCYAARRFSNTNEDDNVEDDMINNDKLFVPSDSSEPGFDLDQSVHLPTTSTTSKRKSKEHECSICHRIFSSGQALGGHKRCHWLTTNLPDNTIIQNLQDQFQFDHSPPFFKKPKIGKPENLDLNSPPTLDNAGIDHHHHGNIKTPFKYDHAPAARIFLQLWGSEQVDNNNHNHNKKQEQKQSQQIMHDSLEDLNNNSDEECRVKLAKLSDLKDMNVDGGSSGWLRVGIASTTEMTATP